MGRGGKTVPLMIREQKKKKKSVREKAQERKQKKWGEMSHMQ